MNRMIFINLPVRDLEVSRAFYTGLGFELNAQFSDEQCACVIVSDTIFVMVMVRERFADFTNKPICDAATEVINCLSAESRDEVDRLHRNALTHGGSPWMDKMEDGPMYGHSFADPDGHAWEVLYMDLDMERRTC